MSETNKDSPTQDDSSAAETPAQQEASAEAQERRWIEVAASFEGPAPPPSILQGYEDVLPGAAERIFKQMEAESRHRRISTILGQCFGFVLGALPVVLATVLVYMGFGYPGALISVASLGAAASAASLFRRRAGQ